MVKPEHEAGLERDAVALLGDRRVGQIVVVEQIGKVGLGDFLLIVEDRGPGGPKKADCRVHMFWQGDPLSCTQWGLSADRAMALVRGFTEGVDAAWRVEGPRRGQE